MMATEHHVLLGTGGTVFMAAYLVSLIGIGVAGRIARRENTLEDHYLSSRGMGMFVMFLTLYATQYSGNTLIGFAGKAYRDGFFFLVSVTFMMSVIGAYLIYAPRLYHLSRRRGYLTVSDYIQDRFGSGILTFLVTLVCIVALGNYILSNLKAIGYIVEVSTGGEVSYAGGIVALALIMVIYETLGGLRSVAWTDVLQGMLLLVGCALIFAGMQYQYGGLSIAADTLMRVRPDLWAPPDAAHKRLWCSTLLIVFFGISIYPHAIQRIYAAKSETTLVRSFQVMVFMPLVTTFFMLAVGVVGAARFPGLDRAGSEQITMLMLSDLGAHLPGFGAMMVLFICAAVAAIMSTVDSALLAISSLVTQNVYRPLAPNAPETHLTYMGKAVSWVVMGLMAWLAIVLPQTIWRLIEIKLEILMQVAPAIFLGLHLKCLSTRGVLYGLVAGLATTLAIMALPGVPNKPWHVHAGVWGLMVNLLVIAFMSPGLRELRARGRTSPS